MRIIAGEFRSRRLQSLPGMDVRPTSDRLRETLFDVIQSGDLDRLRGTNWLDLYAGTGAVGLEALSRGAAHVTFVESARSAAAVIQKNLASLGVPPARYEVVTAKARVAVARLESQGSEFDFCFLDPPYRMREEYAAVLAQLAGSTVSRAGSVIIAEHPPKFDPGPHFEGMERFRLLRQGDAALSFYRKSNV